MKIGLGSNNENFGALCNGRGLDPAYSARQREWKKDRAKRQRVQKRVRSRSTARDSPFSFWCQQLRRQRDKKRKTNNLRETLECATKNISVESANARLLFCLKYYYYESDPFFIDQERWSWLWTTLSEDLEGQLFSGCPSLNHVFKPWPSSCVRNVPRWQGPPIDVKTTFASLI